ncbi:MAG: C40 family peptidase, partial [Bacteroidota bacterium]
VVTTYDKYRGWMDQKQLIPCHANRENHTCSLDLSQPIFLDSDSTMITMGATLPDYDGIGGVIGGKSYRYSGQVNSRQTDPKDEFVIKLAKKLLNAPYLWGGRTPYGIDCSGFTQLIYKCLGIRISRDSSMQALEGEHIDFVNAANVGDLAFFSKETDRITHVGMLLTDQKIIHASGHVRIDTVDHYGIYNSDLNEYTHRLKIIKRFW